MINIEEKIKDGKIVMIPLNGSAHVIKEIPQGLACHYSGKHLILSGDQTQGDFNLNVESALGVKVIGDAVALSQEVWHKIK